MLRKSLCGEAVLVLYLAANLVLVIRGAQFLIGTKLLETPLSRIVPIWLARVIDTISLTSTAIKRVRFKEWLSYPNHCLPRAQAMLDFWNLSILPREL